MFGSAKVTPLLPFSRLEFIRSAPKKTKGFSISGVRIKAQLDIKDATLIMVERGGRYILKPSPEEYPHAAVNEHLSMLLIEQLRIPVPPCGLVSFSDGEPAYVVQRFDRTQDDGLIHQEDLMQVLGLHNQASGSKYGDASYLDALLKLADLGGVILARELYRRIIAAYLIGNEDYHLKNISLLHRQPIIMTPAYDYLNTLLHTQSGTSMALRFYPDKDPTYFTEMGNGHYSGGDFLELANAAGLPSGLAVRDLQDLLDRSGAFDMLIEASALPDEMKVRYRAIVEERRQFLAVF